MTRPAKASEWEKSRKASRAAERACVEELACYLEGPARMGDDPLPPEQTLDFDGLAELRRLFEASAEARNREQSSLNEGRRSNS